MRILTKQSLRVFAMLIALVMLVPTVFSACAKNNEPTETATDTSNPELTSGPSQASTDSAEPETEDYQIEEANFNTELTVLYWEDVENMEFFPETGDMSNSIESALFNRNDYVTKRLGITFDWRPTEGNYSNLQNFLDVAKADVENEHDCDIFAGYSMIGAMLATKGLVENLLDDTYNDYIDFSMPWWPQKLVQTASIKNKLYFCSGDISTNLLHMMYAIIYNKNLASTYGISEGMLYELVENKQWTLDKMFELCVPLKNDNPFDPSDLESKYGFGTGDIHYDLFFTGCGIDTITKDNDGNLAISDSWNSEKTGNLINKMRNFLYTSGCAFVDNNNYNKVFTSGQVLFTANRVQILEKDLADVADIKFGLLPAPLYDGQQENYSTCVAFPFTVYAVSRTSHDKAASAATLNAMGLGGYKYVTPVVFENAMKLKYSDDEKDAQMFDLIHDTIYIEVGRIFAKSLNGRVYNLFRSAVTSTDATVSFSTNFKRAKASIESDLKTLNKTLDELK